MRPRGIRHVIAVSIAVSIAVLTGVSILALSVDATAAAPGDQRFTIDFEGFSPGDTVNAVKAGTIEVAVTGVREIRPGRQRAMIFDGECNGSARRCTGGDPDLFFPGQGNLLIVSEDGDASDPDDAGDGIFTFEFDAPVRVETFLLLDTDSARPSLRIVDDAGQVTTRRLAATGNNRSIAVAVNANEVRSIQIRMNGLGAIDDLVIVAPGSVDSTTTTSITSSTTSTTSTRLATTTSTTVVAWGPAGMSIAVSANGADAGRAPGFRFDPATPISWEYRVTNTGGESLWALFIWHDGVGSADCPGGALAPRATVVCTGGSIAGTDDEAARVTAEAWTASGDEVEADVTAYTMGVSVTTTTTIPGVAGLSVVVTANGSETGAAPGPQVDAGDPISWQYTVTNTGSENLWALFVWHEGVGGAACLDAALSPGETVTCTGQSIGEASDIAAEISSEAWTSSGDEISVDVIAHTSASSGTGSTTTTTTNPGSLPAAIEVAVMANGSDAGTAPGPEIARGEDISWEYRVTNTGGEDLWALFLWHDGVGGATCVDGALIPGETVVCAGTSIGEASNTRGEVSAEAWTTAGDEIAIGITAHTVTPGATTSSTTTTTIPAGTASLELAITVNGSSAPAAPGPAILVGDQVAIDYRVTNTGGVDLWAVYLVDDARGRIVCPTRELQVDATVVCSVTDAAGVGPVASSATVTAWDDDGDAFQDDAIYHFVGVDPTPGVVIQTYVEGFDADSPPGPRVKSPGERISFTYAVTNVGSAELTGVVIDDDIMHEIWCAEDTIAAGATIVCEAGMEAWWGNVFSGATVEAWSGTTRVTDRDLTHWHTRNEPRIHNLTLELSVNGQDADDPLGPVIEVGRSANFVYFVRNNGNTFINDIEIRDPHVPWSSISCNWSGVRYPGILRAGESVRCTATVPAAQGPYSSQTLAVGWDNDGRRVEAPDAVHYLGIL